MHLCTYVKINRIMLRHLYCDNMDSWTRSMVANRSHFILTRVPPTLLDLSIPILPHSPTRVDRSLAYSHVAWASRAPPSNIWLCKRSKDRISWAPREIMLTSVHCTAWAPGEIMLTSVHCTAWAPGEITLTPGAVLYRRAGIGGNTSRSKKSRCAARNVESNTWR